VRSTRQNRRASDQSVWRGGAPDPRTLLTALGAGILVLGSVLAWMLSRTAVVYDASPNWSPDGELIAFVSQERERVDLNVMHADGTARQPIEEIGREGSPAFSPDGASLVFDSDRDGNAEIYVRRLNSGTARRLTSHPARDWGAVWSPDGASLVFMSNRDAPAGADLYRMRADGSGVERLTRTGTSRFARFSPDGSALALEVGSDIYVLSLAGRTLRQLTYAPEGGARPAWSPDGQRLAFVSRRRGRSEIFTMDRDGSNVALQVSMAQGAALDPCWSPDGASLAFVHAPETGADPVLERRAHAIYTVQLSSGRLVRLSP
jgi:TolB protein